MNQTFYGVDIILHPEKKRGAQLHEQGKVIEINGLRSGASLYRIGDYDFYRKVMKEFSDNAEGKLILLNYDPEWEFKKSENEDMKNARGQYYAEQVARTRQWQEHLATSPQTNFYSAHDFLMEKIGWEKEHASKFKASQTALYLRAAHEAGINVDSFVHIKGFGGLIKYLRKEIDPFFYRKFAFERKPDEPIAELNYGEVPPAHFICKYIPVEGLGLLWSAFCKADEFVLGRERVLNGLFEEAVLNDKALFYFYSQFLPPEQRGLERFLPKSFLYGLGLHTQEGFRQWVSSVSSGIFVKKPLFEAHGIGVEFLAREQLAKYDRSPFHKQNPAAIEEGYRRLVMDLVLGDINLKEETVVFQEGVESMKVRDELTGKEYTACARVIVQNGRFVSAIWRSNKKDNECLSLTERLRHNVTYGAEVMPVSEKDLRLLAEIAEAAVCEFEGTNRRIKEFLGDADVPYYDLYKGRHDVDQHLMALTNRFYLGRIKKAAGHHGVDISGSLERWVEEEGFGAESTPSFVDKIKAFNQSL